ncbi:hypothetical protein [Aromatoleum evansii]|uniref:hypothetical protein n=1 Tax=Aromatoleum evansii TaxID=59406 RepID=UPI00145FAFFF|nr:hypothetical protein [Aromatoleum evansii]NMG29571.1 hypothetical protein [Aromatoleum evansii]
MGPFHSNELRDFALRAPKPVEFDGLRLVSHERVRHRWLEEMHSGSIHERINRRAGVKVFNAPFYAPWRGTRSAIQRHIRRMLQIAGFRSICHAHRAC